MKPQRPYLLRALYEWIVDSDEVPYVLIDTSVDGVAVPEAHVKNNQIVLNLGPNAVRDLSIGDDAVTCGGRFSGQHFDLYLPMAAIRAIYARDTQLGMVFPDEEGLAGSPAGSGNDDGKASAGSSTDGAASGNDPEPPSGGEKPNLRLV